MLCTRWIHICSYIKAAEQCRSMIPQLSLVTLGTMKYENVRCFVFDVVIESWTISEDMNCACVRVCVKA